MMNKVSALLNRIPFVIPYSLLLSLCLLSSGCVKKPSLSLREVDERANQGAYAKKHPALKTAKSVLKEFTPAPLPPSLLRTQEGVLTLWIAPYQTIDGSYHEAKRIHCLCSPSTWLNTPYETDHETE